MPRLLDATLLESRNTQSSFVVSYDLHGVGEDSNDHAVAHDVLRELVNRDKGDVAKVTRKRVSTLWNVSTTMDRDHLAACIVKALREAKGQGRLTDADSITIVIVRVSGTYRVAKSKL